MLIYVVIDNIIRYISAGCTKISPTPKMLSPIFFFSTQEILFAIYKNFFLSFFSYSHLLIHEEGYCKIYVRDLLTKLRFLSLHPFLPIFEPIFLWYENKKVKKTSKTLIITVVITLLIITVAVTTLVKMSHYVIRKLHR